ncbi:MAG: penicillin-binding protein 2 [Thermodesulfobacteriota bacterium]
MASYIEGSIEPEWFRKRLNLVLVWISIAFLFIGARLFWLQVIHGEKFRQLSLNNRIRLQRLAPSRGLIFDRNNTTIVDNRPAFNLKVVPGDVDSLKTLMEKLENYVEIDKETFEKLKQALRYTPFKPFTVASDIKRETVALIESNQYSLPGTYISVEPKREYIYPGTASHVIGYLGEADTKFIKARPETPFRSGDNVGRAGIEKKYEDFLRGKYGGAQVEVNARGKVMKVLDEVEAEPGNNIVLTLDFEIQKYAMELLGDKTGAVVAMIPDTGEIICMASSPAFNENSFITGLSTKEWKKLANDPNRPLQNKAIQGEYPPGSIYKMIPALAGLEEGIVEQDDTFYCSGRYFYGDRFFKCWNDYGHGNINLKDSIIQSCDVYFYKLGNKLGIDKLAEYARMFGMGKKTGIELDNEEKGLVPDSVWKRQRFNSSWQGGETLSVVIGQGYNLVTPLQMAVMTSALANGGEIVKPLLVKKIQSSKGEVIKRIEKEKIDVLDIKEESLELVRESMRDVVNTPVGTAFSARSDLVEISGKTGTAQVVSSLKYKENMGKIKNWLPHAWFTAYAPSENPGIAVTVLVEHGDHGSTSAAPIAKKIIEKYCMDRKND